MAEVKWIKIATDIFDDEAIQLIEQLPDGDSIIVIWFKLLAKAGQINDSGLIYFKENIPYTEEMLATVFRRPIATIRLAIQTFVNFGMIEITDQNTLLISNWEKHQNIDGMDKIREQSRIRMQKYRDRKNKLLLEHKECYATVTQQLRTVTHLDIEEDKEIDIDIELDKENKEIKIEEDLEEKAILSKNIKEFFDAYNQSAIRLPKAKKLSDSRKNKIKARLKDEDIETWKRVFEKCENSDFCCGINKQNWIANLDWLIANDNNYVKVLEGKYDNKTGNNVNGQNNVLKNGNSNALKVLQQAGMEIL